MGEIKLRKTGGVISFHDPKFPKLNELLDDANRFQGWQGTRRSAKSNSYARKVIKKLHSNPGSKALYMALTLDSAKEILWDVIENLLIEKGIKHETNKTKGIFTLDNGATLRFFGVDSSYKEMKKVLGQMYIDIGIDEVGSMTIDMPKLVFNMIFAALSDLSGSLTLLGTAENIPNTFFEKVMTGKETTLPWSLHKWDTYQNPYMKDKWDADIKMLKEQNPLVIHTSWFKTHWLNQWCADDELKIFTLTDANKIKELPSGKYHYSLGVDLGFNDANSFIVSAHKDNDPTLYFVKAIKEPGLDLTDVANIIKALDAQYDFFKITIDGANKQGVVEIRNRHKIGKTLESAEKTDKATFMRLMADDFKQVRIVIVEKDCEPLIAEYESLMWIKGTDQEDPRCQNHASDGALYNWRSCRNYLNIPKESPWQHPEQKMLEIFKKESRELKRREKEENFLF